MGIAPSTFPPVEVVRWLDRRPGLKVFTESQIDEAVAWLDKELHQQLPLDAEAFPVATRLEYSRARLRETVNRDVWYGYWSKGGQFVTRALIACKSTERNKGCA